MKEIEKYISTFESTKSNENKSQLFSQRNRDKIIPTQNKIEILYLKWIMLIKMKLSLITNYL